MSARGETFEISCGSPNTGCLIVTQLERPHAKRHPQTGTHIQTAPRLSHRYISVLCFTSPPTPDSSTDRHRTHKTVQHTTKHSYLHPHPQECPPDNKSSVSDQGSCHLAVLILRQKSQSHMNALRLGHMAGNDMPLLTSGKPRLPGTK